MSSEVVIHSSKTHQRQSSSLLSFYLHPPTEEITIEQMEDYCINRMNVLKGIENAMAKKVFGDNLRQFIKKLLIETKFYSDRVGDNISHFLLRLGCCRNEDLRSWFLKYECILFNNRFGSTNFDEIDIFLQENGLNFQSIVVTSRSDEKKEIIELKEKLGCYGSLDSVYYKVEFEKVLDLVKKRSCYLQEGFAFVPRKYLSNIITPMFRTNLSKQLTLLSKEPPIDDVRLKRMMKMIQQKSITAPLYKSVSMKQVSLNELPLLSKRSFPLCMSHTYNESIRNSHLTHGGRMQLGLFFKGIGLSLNDSLQWWRNTFSSRTTLERFEKEYAYNIRHMYGKEGNRTSYTPYGCMKIITSQPGNRDHHGCPFRHFDEKNLRIEMQKNNNNNDSKMTTQQKNEIIDLVKSKHYQVACVKYFSIRHPSMPTTTIGNHPNAYFDASNKYYNKQEPNKKDVK
jgi:DNA primase large subunit